MYIITGATGHIGSEVVKALLAASQRVTGITSDPANKKKIESQGAAAVVADVSDTPKLTEVFNKGIRLYLLNPPAPIDGDPSEKENTQVDSLIAAIRKSTFEKVVAASTYGAQQGKRLGDLDVLFNMEGKLKGAVRDCCIIRGAYYLSNWDMAISMARSDGKIYSLYPPAFKLPMVAPADLAARAVSALLSPPAGHELIQLEGPARYSANDIAKTLGDILHKRIQAVSIRQEDWHPWLVKSGFSPRAAESMVNMTRLTLEGHFPDEKDVEKGDTTPEMYFRKLLKK
ncbi:MAG: NAD-dependent epimerase/dehydratase family protein [Chitinophagaceae bacterium]|nr:MAG: NAD-dependent epimerase/dehydratase family protein [Chitinophagaceae bacterium]